jgi:hypothetical protein
MRTKSLLRAAIIMAAACTLMMAKDFWEKPYKEWKKNEAFKMKDNSPWAKSQTMASTISRRGASTDRLGDAGKSDIYNSVTVRFFSALPIRQAYVRIMQLMNNYDAKSDEEKTILDARLSAVLKRDFSKMIVVELEYAGNDPESQRNVKNYLLQVKADHLKQNCYLISDRLGRVTLEEYYPPSADGSGAKFVFPRMVSDKPVVTPEDKELNFDFWFEPVEQKVFIRFKVKELMYGGELAF